MNNDFLARYRLIVNGKDVPSEYATPEQQGKAIRRCTILSPTDVAYSNSTKTDSEKTIS